MASLKKQLLVDKIVSLLKEYPNFALVSFGQTSHNSLENLRKELGKNVSLLQVVKNALLEKALAKLSQENKKFKEILSLFPLRENTALLAFKEDFMTGLGTFNKESKKESGLIFKFGFLDSKVYTSGDLMKMAQLPGKDYLLSKLIASLKSPQMRLVYALKFGVSKLTYVLKAKGGEQN